MRTLSGDPPLPILQTPSAGHCLDTHGKRVPREFRNLRVQGNPPTLRQPFANLFCQPLSKPLFPWAPGTRLEARVNGFLETSSLTCGEKRSEILAKNVADFRPFIFKEKCAQKNSRKNPPQIRKWPGITARFLYKAGAQTPETFEKFSGRLSEDFFLSGGCPNRSSSITAKAWISAPHV